MLRPVSIVWFERCYLGALLIGLINAALRWPEMTAAAANQPNVDQLGPSFVPTILIVSLVVGFGISLLLWYFAARRRANVAKWIITIFFVLGLLSLGFTAMTGAFPKGLGGVVSVVTWVLNAIAVWQLFRPDAEAWFENKAPIESATRL